MIIDVHTHTSLSRYSVPPDKTKFSTTTRPDRPRKHPVSWDEQVEAMAPVDKAIVFSIAPAGGGDNRGLALPSLEGIPATARGLNDMTAEFVRAHSDKLIGFLSVSPRDPGALEEIERSTEDLGLRGIKFGPSYQNFHPVSEEAFKLYARAQDLKLPVLFHEGTTPVQFADLDYGHPRHIDRVAMAFPNLKIIMAHMGHPWQVDCITVIRKHPNVYADISALFYRPWSWYGCMRLAAEWGVMHKLLFASDYSAATPQETIDGCRRVNAILEGTKLPRVPENAMEEIIHRDSLDLLGLG